MGREGGQVIRLGSTVFEGTNCKTFRKPPKNVGGREAGEHLVKD